MTTTICRSLIETVYKLSAIQITNDGINLYIAQERKSGLQKLKGVQVYRKAHPQLGSSQELDAEVEALKKERPKKTEPNEWATLAQMDDFHNLYYQGMSDDTHASIESLSHYFDQASPYLMSFGPTDFGVAPVGAICHRAIFVAIERYASFRGVASDLGEYSTENDVLEKKYAEMLAAARRESTG